MRYSLFAGGKRIARSCAWLPRHGLGGRARSLGGRLRARVHPHLLADPRRSARAPTTTNLRRGQATCHKQFGEAMAILAGDALLTVAFQLLSQAHGVDPARRAILIAELSTLRAPWAE